MKTYENKLATKQGMNFEEIIFDVNKSNSALSLKVSPTKEVYANTLLGFGKCYPVLLTSINSKTYEVVQYLIGAFDEYDMAMKDLKKFQRQFKKLTGFSLLKNRVDNITNEPIWTAFIK